MALDPGRSTASPLTVTGRVRAGGTMCRPGGPERCVVSTSWASDRPYPRTAGMAVPFEVETEGGQRYLIEPRDAAVRLAVRRRESVAGLPNGHGARPVIREAGWLGPGEDVVVEGHLDPKAKSRSPAPRLLARRITAPGNGTTAGTLPVAPPHVVPPRLLTPGAIEPEPIPPPTAPEPIRAPLPSRERTPPPVTVAPAVSTPPADPPPQTPETDLPVLARAARRRPKGKSTVE